jgi:hypothetical protein
MATKRLCTSLRETTGSSSFGGLIPETSVRCEKGLMKDGNCPEDCEGFVDKLELAFGKKD